MQLTPGCILSKHVAWITSCKKVDGQRAEVSENLARSHLIQPPPELPKVSSLQESSSDRRLLLLLQSQQSDLVGCIQ